MLHVSIDCFKYACSYIVVYHTEIFAVRTFIMYIIHLSMQPYARWQHCDTERVLGRYTSIYFLLSQTPTMMGPADNKELWGVNRRAMAELFKICAKVPMLIPFVMWLHSILWMDHSLLLIILLSCTQNPHPFSKIGNWLNSFTPLPHCGTADGCEVRHPSGRLAQDLSHGGTEYPEIPL